MVGIGLNTMSNSYFLGGVIRNSISISCHWCTTRFFRLLFFFFFVPTFSQSLLFAFISDAKCPTRGSRAQLVTLNHHDASYLFKIGVSLPSDQTNFLENKLSEQNHNMLNLRKGFHSYSKYIICKSQDTD